MMCHGIPQFRERLRALYLISYFQEEADQLLDPLVSLVQAQREILDSSQLKVFLGIILSVGNYLNGDVEDASALCIDSLRILASTKNIDNSFSLLDFVVHIYETVLFHDRFEILKDLEHLPRASIGWTLGELECKIRQLIEEFHSTASAVKNLDSDDILLGLWNAFDMQASLRVRQLETELKVLFSTEQICLQYFCCLSGSSSIANSRQLFEAINAFVSAIIHSKSINSKYIKN
jgi:hypothetical protein